jgi:hypothetical protein
MPHTSPGTASAPATIGNPAIVSDETLERMWQLTPKQRQAAFRRGEFPLAAISRAAARFPGEFETINGEFWHLALLLADLDDD